MRSFLFYQCDACLSWHVEPGVCAECKGTVFTPKQVVFSAKEIDLFDNKKATLLDVINSRKPKK